MKWIAVFLVLVLSCGYCLAQQDAASDEIITITGKIQHFSYEDGFYGIAGDDGKTYKPVRLIDSFKREGLRVRVQARPITKKLLVKPWGIPIDIIKIERVSS